MGCTKDFSEMLFRITELSEEDISALQKLILDFFAASYAGYDINAKFNRQVERAVLSQGGSEEATVFLKNVKLPAVKAAFMNSLYAHGAELDDGNKKAMGHIGVHVIPAVFALAEKTGATYDEVLLALAVGYETYIRISTAAQPGMVKRGYHSTGVCGTLGCAAACASLLKLDAAGIENSIALATTMTGGLLSYGDSRPVIKPLNPAKAAENGLLAALLASEGMEGPEEALEGQNGWFHAVTENYDESALLRKEGEHLLLHECYIKLYPSCRHTHCGLEAGTILHQRISPEKIKEVEVYIYPNAIHLAGIPYPKDQDETKFSIQYTLACGLLNGSYGVADMKKADGGKMPPEISGFIPKIRLIPDESMENREKGIRGARVRVLLEDGSFEEETVLVPKGDPEKPLFFDDVIDKLRVCAGNMADEKKIRELVQYVKDFSGPEKFRYPEF